MSELSVRDRAAPVLEIETGPMRLAIDLAVGTAECLVRRARLTRRAPESVVETIVGSHLG